MKKRIELSGDQLEKVVQLRQGKRYSWLRIQKETAIPRRIAKREYLKWEQEQGREYLHTVRREVAAEEFRFHLDTLVELARQFTLILRSPGPHETRDADQVITDGLRNLKGYDTIHDDLRILESFTFRQRWWIYEALRVHTRESVPWDKMEYWKRQWNDCVKDLQRLRSKMKSDLFQEHSAAMTDPDVQSIVDYVWEQVWLWISDGIPESTADDILTRMNESLGRHGVEIPLEMEKVCAQQVGYLLTEVEAGFVKQSIRRLREAARQLEETLDKIKLRPVLLRTRCDLCPA